MYRRISLDELARIGVTVHLPPSLRSYTGGQDEVVLDAADVAALLRSLDVAFPGIGECVLDEAGHPRPYVNVFVNDELVRAPLGQARLSPGDAVHILPSVAGGLIG